MVEEFGKYNRLKHPEDDPGKATTNDQSTSPRDDL